MKQTINEYEKQANDFLSKTNTSFSVKFLKYDKHFNDDTDKRDIYEVTFQRGERGFKVIFGQSIYCSGKYKYFTFVSNDFKDLKKQVKKPSLTQNEVLINQNFKEPNAYDVLACLQKYNVGTFKDFCNDFGYDTDSIKAHKIFVACLEEYKNVCMLWNETELEELQEIQ